MIKISRHVFMVFTIAAFSISLASITPCFAAGSDVANSKQSDNQALESDAGKFVQDLGERAIKIIADKQRTTEQRNAGFSKILNDSFDLDTIGRFVSGRAWNTATPSQQAEYMDLFKALIIKDYGSRIALATGQNFQVIGIRRDPGMDTTVLTQFTHRDGSDPTSIDWLVRQRDGKMGVIDVVFEGVSLSITQRDEYTSVVQNSGGHIDGLLFAMRRELYPPTATASAQ